ncbi:Uma2 family endonuclease [Streptomyces sp. AV19]|uniref:Uma2 family endonuclease n=1 Tax=Streptomyces sp. AV19 TaxID=2793068 RepID=UPI0018FEA2C6|nr:Uma2 family endonuclease [Streptomyces sp. AV19]MBH1936026.1 Uma2 family endonuclease [Streptomyces sp. AV19]MDG4534182.1 Uma2 family endonuclease [Streptomyces sp. AV19]
MTPTPAERLVEKFEELAHSAPETVRLELINGRIEVKPVPDGKHGAIVMWLLRQCMQQRPDLDLHRDQGLRVEKYRRGRAIPDGILAPVDHFVDERGEWADPKGILMVVEVTSNDADTDRRDRVEKPVGYAAAGIPVYLLIDRDDRSVTVHYGPEADGYRHRVNESYGTPIEVPEPVGITLDTEQLKKYAD